MVVDVSPPRYHRMTCTYAYQIPKFQFYRDRGSLYSSHSTAQETYRCRVEVLETARVVIYTNPNGPSSAKQPRGKIKPQDYTDKTGHRPRRTKPRSKLRRGLHPGTRIVGQPRCSIYVEFQGMRQPRTVKVEVGRRVMSEIALITVE